MTAFRILALDGGGIRGVLTAVILERLEAEFPGFLSQIDLFAGTSTGGFIALGLADGMTPLHLKELYVRNATKIFDDSWIDDISDLGVIAGAEYDNRQLKAVMRRMFKDRMLGSLPRHVLIPTFDLDNEGAGGRPRQWKPKFFHNFNGPGDDRGASIVDVALATSAGPTFFPSYKGYVDGGVVANNPSVAAVAQALDRRYEPHASLRDIRLLSLGTGISPRYIAGETHDWGYAQWARPLLSLIIDGNLGIADYECRQLLSDRRYFRLAPLFNPGVQIDLDDIKRIDDLLSIAHAVDVSEAVRFLRRW